MKKQILRLKFKQIRNNLDKESSINASRSICEKLVSLITSFKSYKDLIIGIYIPIYNEVDILQIFELTNISKFAIPVIQESLMQFHLFDKDTKLVKRSFSFEPELLDNFVNPDIFIIPMLSYDRCGNRLGYGKGYYDKILASYSNVYKIGVAYSAQESKLIPAEEHDIKLDLIVTEREVININAS